MSNCLADMSEIDSNMPLTVCRDFRSRSGTTVRTALARAELRMGGVMESRMGSQIESRSLNMRMGFSCLHMCCLVKQSFVEYSHEKLPH